MTDKWVKRWTVNGNSDFYTVAVDQDGNWGCSCKAWIFQREKPRKDCQHIKDLRKRLENPPKPWPGTWDALNILPAGEERALPNELGEVARRVLAYAEADYVRRGYAYSGFVHIQTVERELGLEPNGDAVWDAFTELREAGLLRQRACQGFALELPPERRWQLIREHELHDAWERKSTGFYPNRRYGEICQVWQELMGFQFCERCRTWYAGEHGPCQPFDYLIAEVVL